MSYSQTAKITSMPSLPSARRSSTAQFGKGGPAPVPGLLYYEFLPLVRRSKDTGRLEFQEFEDVLERASDWYSQVHGYRVVTLETVQFKFRDREPSERSIPTFDVSTSNPAAAKSHYYGDGLRVWLFPSELHAAGGVELGYRDLLPRCVEKQGRSCYETVPEILERFNESQDHGPDPLPGKIISVESRDVDEPSRSSGSRISTAVEGDVLTCYQLFSFRVFFYRGRPTRERIPTTRARPEIHDVVPKPFDYYTFEEFTEVLKRASQWLQSQSPLRLYNVQTLFVKAKLHAPPGSVLSRKVSSLVRYLKVLRVVYSTFPEASREFTSLQFPRCLSHRVFIPALTVGGEDVKVAQAIRALKDKMSLWSTMLRGNILCAESLTVDFVPSGHGADDSISTSVPSRRSSTGSQRTARVVLYFRVYTDCPDNRAKADSPVSMVVRPQFHSDGEERRKCSIM
ncbi:unnamed protein product [Ixodes hexagonus]